MHRLLKNLCIVTIIFILAALIIPFFIKSVSANSETSYIDVGNMKCIPYQSNIKTYYHNFKYDLDIESKDISYSLNYDNLDIKIEFLLTGCVYKNHVKNILKNIEIDEDSKPKTKSEDDSLIVYYASPGESVWDLAKKYNTSISAILEENENLENNIITEKRILLIPIIS